MNPSALDPDEPLHSIGDLAMALGGSGSSFTGDLLRLVAKADLGNRRRLAEAFGEYVAAWEAWVSESATTAGEARAVADARVAGHVPARTASRTPPPATGR